MQSVIAGMFIVAGVLAAAGVCFSIIVLMGNGESIAIELVVGVVVSGMPVTVISLRLVRMLSICYAGSGGLTLLPSAWRFMKPVSPIHTSSTIDQWLFGWDATAGIVSCWAERSGRALVWQRLHGKVSCEHAR